MTDIKACPFCGGKAEQSYAVAIITVRFMKCTMCGAQGPMAFDKPGASSLWNTRRDVENEVELGLKIIAGLREALDYAADVKVVESCGCVFCDLGISRNYDNCGPYHMRGEVTLRCKAKE